MHEKMNIGSSSNQKERKKERKERETICKNHARSSWKMGKG
jgi:hypothetical protein